MGSSRAGNPHRGRARARPITYNACMTLDLFPDEPAVEPGEQVEGVTVQLELSGKRVINFARFQGWKAEHTYTQFEDKPAYEQVEPIADKYIKMFVTGQVDQVQVAYMKFLNAARQMPVVETLLPLSTAPAAGDKAPKQQVEYEFLPSARDILEEILPVSFKIRLFKCFLDAAVSEQIARRVAMKAATENAGDMIKSLTRQYNRARQAQITKEIAEVIEFLATTRATYMQGHNLVVDGGYLIH